MPATTSKSDPQLHGLWALFSDDQLQLKDEVENIASRAGLSGYPPKIFVVIQNIDDLQQVKTEHSSGSLFADKRFTQINFTSAPGASERKVLSQLAERLSDSDLIVATIPTPTNKKVPAWANKAQFARVIPALRPRDYPNWANRLAKRLEVNISAEALNHLLSLYANNPLAIHMELKRLSLCGFEQEITLSDLESSLSDGLANFSVGDLWNASIAGDAASASRVLKRMEQESGQHHMLVLYTFWRELTNIGKVAAMAEQGTPVEAACERVGVWRSRIGGIARAYRRRPSANYWRRLTSRAAWIDSCVKGRQYGDPDLEIRNLVMAVCGLAIVPPPRLTPTQ